MENLSPRVFATTTPLFPKRTANETASVNFGYITAGTLPLVIRPAFRTLDLLEWGKTYRGLINARLLQEGGILFRGFDLRSVEEFEQLVQVVSGKLFDDSFRSTPRSNVSGKIYTSAEYPPHQAIPLHNENSHSRNWPFKLWFFSMQVAQRGGKTPLADSRKIFSAIPAQIRDCFLRKGLSYVRNYGPEMDLPWQKAFQTSNKLAVENYCRRAAIDFEWIGKDQLRTRQRCQVSAKHPQTGERVWFNQAHLLHVSRLPVEVRDWLLSAFGEENLPRNVYFADGSPIQPAMLHEISKVYGEQSITFPWQEGDVLMLDNMLVAHGRQPFEGKRRVVVGMAEANE